MWISFTINICSRNKEKLKYAYFIYADLNDNNPSYFNKEYKCISPGLRNYTFAIISST